MAAMLADVALPPLLAGVGVYFFGLWLRAVRWRRLMAPFAPVTAGRLFRVIVIGFAVNNVLPFRLGELVRTFLLRHSNGVPVAAALASILLERVFDVVTLCGLLVVVALFIPLGGWLAGVAGLAWLVVVGAVGGLTVALLAPRRLLRRTLDVGLRAADRLGPRAGGLARSFLGGISGVGSVGALVQVGLLSLASWLAELGLYYFVMLAFGFDSGILSLVAGMVVANLATVLPSSPGYVGTFDVPLQSTLSETFGVGASLAASYTVLTHALLLVPVVALGLVFLGRENLSLRALTRGRVQPRSGRHPVGVGSGAPLSEERERWV